MDKELNLPKIEERIQEYWEKENIFKELIEARKSGPKFYFCQGPPFTSGHAHIGHAWNHAIKDAVIRYKSMQGFNVFRRAGWDMHGLPTEVKVEEEVLGSRTKKDIEEYGIENFIQECKKYSIKNMNVMTEQLKRLGVWLDWEDPYQTLDPRYMESVWFCIKKAHEKGLLYADNRVIHWCPRCETAMSGYEVRDEYRNVTDHSIYVKAKVKDKEEAILIWTTTPWTLPANTSIAAHPEFDYVRAKIGNEIIILAKERIHVIEEKYEILEEFKGKELDGIGYEPMLSIPAQKEIKHRVVMAPDLVTLDDGSGLVHIAPGHGEEDFEVGKEHDLDSLSPVDDSGRFTIEPYKRMYVRDANPVIINDLQESGNLYREEKVTHSYPHCWRCKTPLLMRSTPQWFLAVSKIRNKLLEKNREIEWVPDWIGSGRFENWLQNVKDWCISRQRYWNTPLPIWQCSCGEITVIGSIEELCQKSLQNLNPSNIDLHMPSMDSVKLKCSCGKEMSRVRDVMDVWLDSGCASWANLGYPYREEKFKKLFPVDFITEGSDQTRGWFYSLLVSSVIAFDDIAYKRVLYHGFTLDSEGRKMSKSLGNVIEPLDVVNKYGADVLRFYMLSATVPWEDLRFSLESLSAVDRTARILWNTCIFAQTYMKLDKFSPEKEFKSGFEIEDLWLLSRFNSLILEVTEAMERYYLHDACRGLNDFILELSRWYIKLIRDRVWIEGSDPRKISVYVTLHKVLTGLAVLLAPIMPHLSEKIYRDLTGERSIHLLKWPLAEEGKIDKKLEDEMLTAQKISECVKAARQKSGIKLRWPIPRVIIAPKERLDLGRVETIILKACNAKELRVEELKAKIVVKPNLPVLGPKLKNEMGEFVKELGKVKPEEIKDKEEIQIGRFTVKADELIFESRISEDLIAEEFEQGVVYIDSKLDEALFSEAMAREIIRRIQQMRKELNLEELKQISVAIKCSEEFRPHILNNKDFIQHETRSSISFGDERGFSKEWDIEGKKVVITII